MTKFSADRAEKPTTFLSSSLDAAFASNRIEVDAHALHERHELREILRRLLSRLQNQLDVLLRANVAERLHADSATEGVVAKEFRRDLTVFAERIDQASSEKNRAARGRIVVGEFGDRLRSRRKRVDSRVGNFGAPEVARGKLF